MPRCLLVYDISHDRTRAKVADACLDYGLDRIQFSAFVGQLSRTHQEELLLKLKGLIRRWGGNIQLYPLCEKDYQARRVLEVAVRADGAVKADEAIKRDEAITLDLLSSAGVEPIPIGDDDE